MPDHRLHTQGEHFIFYPTGIPPVVFPWKIISTFKSDQMSYLISLLCRFLHQLANHSWNLIGDLRDQPFKECYFTFPQMYINLIQDRETFDTSISFFFLIEIFGPIPNHLSRKLKLRFENPSQFCVGQIFHPLFLFQTLRALEKNPRT